MTDIPTLLELSDNSVTGAVLFGTIVPDIKKPSTFDYLQPVNDKRDIPVLIDLVGIEVHGVRGYAKGQIFTMADRSFVENAKSKKSGRLGVVLSGGSLKLNNPNEDDFASYLKWTRRDNQWRLQSVNVHPLKQADFPEFFKVIAEGYKNKWVFKYPCEVPTSYRPVGGGYDFQMLDGSSFGGERVPVGVATKEQTATTERKPLETQWTKTPPPLPQVAEVSKDFFNSNLSGSLGVSQESNVGDMAKTLQNTRATQTIAQGKKRIENRDEFIKPTKNFKHMEDEVDKSKDQVKANLKYLQKLGKPEKEENDEVASLEEDEELKQDHIIVAENAFAKVYSSWGKTQGEFTGRALFKTAVETLLSRDGRDAKGDPVFNELLELYGADILGFLSCKTPAPRHPMPENEKYEKLAYFLEEQTFYIYYQMIDTILGTGSRLSDSFYQSYHEDISLEKVLEKNPYMLCFIDPRFSIEELDKIAMAWGISPSSQEVLRARNVAYMHNFMLDSSNMVIGDNTMVRLSDLRRGVKSGYLISSFSYNVLQSEGTLIKQSRIESLRYFIRASITPDNFKLNRDKWFKRGGKYHREIRGTNIDSMISDFIKSGLGVRLSFGGTDYVSDYVFARKELYIYQRLYELSKQRVKKLTDEQIQRCLENFEELKTKEFELDEPFKLEQRQADALKLIRNPVMCLTGPAGSGKTTTAEALVYGAETMLGFSEDEIMFCAPTGKAANRLKEVVKRPTRTVNSLFGIGGDSISIKDPDNVRKKDNIRLLVMDESSMPNINLLYEMMIRIEDGTHIYFLGDIEQLPPIGFGKPFANMLTFLPTVVLNVGKRASEKSAISRNAKRIIEESDGVIEDLIDADDFRIVHTQDIAQGVAHVSNIIKYHLGREESPIGFSPVKNMGVVDDPDDIQVITPINKYDWGTVELNKRLQDIFNPLNPNDIYISFPRGPKDSVDFRKGDRVIHTRTNESDRTRFKANEDGSFTVIEDTGINNGEQGKLIGFYYPTSLVFKTNSGDTDEETQKSFSAKGNKNLIYVGVQYSDTDSNTGEAYNFMVFYKAEVNVAMGKQIHVISNELKNLDLAYALTTHKLQGSEAKLVIAIFFPVGRGGFISRNMIYTAESRGKKAEYFIGDVLGRDSTVNKGRKIEQTNRRVSMLDKF